MELRSSRKKQEYQELQITLKGMGFYEEGMELQEMRQILDALQMSVTDEETSFLECDMQQALRESEMDFMPSNNDQFMNSTMMISHHNISPCSSPELPPQTIVVNADVHHSMDWSLPTERLLRKRLAPSSSNADDINNGSQEDQSINDSLEPNVKRFHEIRGPVSVRRLIDSGVNMSNEDDIPSSSNNTSNESSNNGFSIEGSNNIANPMQFSISSAAILGEHERLEDDYEHSEPSM